VKPWERTLLILVCVYATGLSIAVRHDLRRDEDAHKAFADDTRRDVHEIRACLDRDHAMILALIERVEALEQAAKPRVR
jgi:hypothetical protein